MTLLALLACTPGDPTVEGVDGIWLGRRLTVRSDRPSRLTVELSDGRGERTLRFPEVDRRHEVPLLGLLPDDTVDYTVTLSDDRGETTWSGSFSTGGLPPDFPQIDVLAAGPGAPGYTLVPIELNDTDYGFVAALDDEGRVVWAWRVPVQFNALRQTPDGDLLAIGDDSVWKLGMLGEAKVQWGDRRDRALHAGDFRRTDLGRFNHELTLLPDGGFLTLSHQPRTVPDYPCSYPSPSESCGPATLSDSHVVEVAPDGAIRRDWSPADALPTMRIGFGSLGFDKEKIGLDWDHANAVIEIPGGGVLVSMRHQDALAAFEPDGTLRWILGNPDGWPSEYQPYLLTPVGTPFSWTWHQHGPSFGPDGVLWVMDNGNYGHSPYSPAPRTPERSRVVGYRIDQDARTVEQVAERIPSGGLFSQALGDAEEVGGGAIQGDFGIVSQQDDVDNAEFGWGRQCARVVQWDADGQVLTDVRIRGDLDREPLGVQVYRAVHAPSLYAPGIEE